MKKAKHSCSYQERRIRGDLIQQFKIVNGIEKVEWHHPPTFKSEQNRTGPASGVREGTDFRFTRINSMKALE